MKVDNESCRSCKLSVALFCKNLNRFSVVRHSVLGPTHGELGPSLLPRLQQKLGSVSATVLRRWQPPPACGCNRARAAQATREVPRAESGSVAVASASTGVWPSASQAG